MKSAIRKLNDLECKVLQPQVLGSTQICTCAWPKAEQTLLEQARLLSQMDIPFEEATEAEKAILEKAGEILRFRVFDVFTMFLEGFCREDKIAIMTVHERFLWFITELRKEIAQNLEVTEIEKNTPEDCEVDKVDEYFRKAPKCFTEDSWYAVLDDINARWVEQMKKTGKWKDFILRADRELKKLQKKVKQNG